MCTLGIVRGTLSRYRLTVGYHREHSPDSSAESVENWDSVQHLNLILAIEEEYGFQFSPEEMDSAKTVGNIAGLVSARRGV